MNLYLREDVKIEPLCARWYAWHHLISPFQHGLQIKHRHIPLFKSFMADPHTHQEAAKDPELMCGPFMDLAPENVERVSALMLDTLERFQTLLRFCDDLRALEERICASATGHCLDSWYSSLPQSLAGVVEFSYDHRNVPRVSIREQLLYEMEFSRTFQELYLHRTPDCNRKFFLNTPRIDPAPEDVILPMSFDDDRIDMLSRARLTPLTFREIESQLPELASPRVRDALFTDEPPKRVAPKFDGEGVRIRYFGHACALIESRDVSILVDPIFAQTRDSKLATLTLSDLPDQIDYVFISHAHQDHFCFESLLQLRRRIRTIIVPQNVRGSLTDPSMRLALASVGFKSVRTVEDLDYIEVPGGHITSIPFPGEHCDLDVKTRHCAGVSLLGRNFLLLVDSDAVDPGLYERLRPHIHDVDALFLGMECDGAPLTWLYGPLLTKPVARRDDESRRGRGSNCERAYQVARTIGCRAVYVYAMGMEPWNRHLLGLGYTPESIQITESDRFVERCRMDGILAERLQGCREFFFPEALQVRARHA